MGCTHTPNLGLRIDGDWYRLTAAGGAIDIARGRAEDPAVTFKTDVATLRSVAFGREPVAAAERDSLGTGA